MVNVYNTDVKLKMRDGESYCIKSQVNGTITSIESDTGGLNNGVN